MTYLEVCEKLRHIYTAINSLTELAMDDSVHGMDKEAMREECIELHRAAHDTMREFEAEIRKDQSVISEVFYRQGRQPSNEVLDEASNRLAAMNAR